ncbi:MAG: hypothetical protein ABIJ36_01440 [Patescibacteria group bacterium]|nr:hypothetical protein [Patescibacteria group bacterium]
MDDNNDYKKAITEIVQKQIVVLGPDIAILKAKNIEGLEVNDKGEATGFKGNPKEILQGIVDEYLSLSGLVFRNVLAPILKKYPEILVNVIQ